jgi:spore coat polysaccharide biosynthesis protein SpsF
MKRNIYVILQARITSTRLTAKVLMKICNKTIIDLIIERLRQCKKFDDIILAIPDTNQNDVLEEYAKKLGCHHYRGSEEDVLSRYYQTANHFDATDIIRVTGDCPLIDPILVDLMIEHYLKEKIDYAAIGIEGNFPRGLDAEIFSFETLKKVNIEAQHYYEREHVTPYIYEHPELFKIRFIEAENKLRRPELRLTVDTQEDFSFVSEIYKNLYQKDQLFYTEDVIDFLDNHPELLSINACVSQKKLGE